MATSDICQSSGGCKFDSMTELVTASEHNLKSEIVLSVLEINIVEVSDVAGCDWVPDKQPVNSSSDRCTQTSDGHPSKSINHTTPHTARRGSRSRIKKQYDAYDYLNKDMKKELKLESDAIDGESLATSSHTKNNKEARTKEKCVVCGKWFKYMQHHLESHPMKCVVCGKWVKNMQHHLESHPLKCVVCGRWVKNMQHHLDMKKHTKIQCKVCNKVFANMASLRGHARVHIRFACGVCGKGFHGSSTLQKHVQIHTRVKPYKCNVCGKAYSIKHGLNLHMRKHTRPSITQTPMKLYKCDICGEHVCDIYLETHSKLHSKGRENPHIITFMTSDIKMEPEAKRNEEPDTAGVKRSDLLPVLDIKFRQPPNDHPEETITHTSPFTSNTRRGTRSRSKKQHRDYDYSDYADEPTRKMKLHSKKHPQKCDVCGKSVKNMKKHKEQTCGNSTKELFNLADVQGHVFSFTCDVCGKGFDTNCHLQKHKIIHTGQKPHKCHICEKVFAFKHRLKLHIMRVHPQTNAKMHTQLKLYKCNICDIYVKNMETHAKTHSQKCHICSKIFRNLMYLQRHMIIHSKENNYTCEVCGRAFKAIQNLQHHLRTHTGERRYKCDVCGKMFSSNFVLLEHKRIHTGEKPFICDVCGKSYRCVSYFKLHQKMHFGGDRTKCNICGQLVKKIILQRHMITHTGEHPFKCQVCGKAFNRSDNYKTHLKIHDK